MTTTQSRKPQLGRPIPVRLPVDLEEELDAESARDGIPISLLIRRDLLRVRRLGGDVGNPDIVSVKTSSSAPSEAAGAPQDVAALPTSTPLTPDPACVLCGGRGIIRRDGGLWVCSCAGDPRDTSLDVARLAQEAKG